MTHGRVPGRPKSIRKHVAFREMDSLFVQQDMVTNVAVLVVSCALSAMAVGGCKCDTVA